MNVDHSEFPLKRSEVIVDQALFGYSTGHELIQASTSLESSALKLLSRLTDGTGAEAHDGFDGYLSGFPIGDSRYAITRTWRASEVSRPGAVWTHVLMVDARTLSIIHSPWTLISALKRPNARDLRYNHSIVLPLSAGKKSSLPSPESTRWSGVATALYASDSTPVALHADSTIVEEGGVLALWWWQWPALRRRFAFTLGALGSRKLKGREFDLIVLPPNSRPAVRDMIVEPRNVSPYGAYIWTDATSDERSDYRRYMNFCGAETSNRSSAALLTNAWLIATAQTHSTPSKQSALLDRITKTYPSPLAMRRLKRATVANTGRFPVVWDTLDTLELLSIPEYAAAISAEDADIGQLLEVAKGSPDYLLLAARSDSEDDDEDVPAVSESELSVAGALPRAARLCILGQAQPAWLDDIIRVRPALAVATLLQSRGDRSDWARSYFALDGDARQAIDAAYQEQVALTRKRFLARAGLDLLPADREVRAPSPNLGRHRSAGWIAAYAPTCLEGIAWLNAAHQPGPPLREALTQLAVELDDIPPESLMSWHAQVMDEDLIGEALLISSTSSRKAARTVKTLLFCVDPSQKAFSEAGLEPWAVLDRTLLGGVCASHLLRATPGSAPPSERTTRLAAQAYAEVWESLVINSLITWQALGDFPARLGKGADWDHARRVSSRVASVLTEWARDAVDANLFESFLAAVSDSSSGAAEQLSSELDDVLRPATRGSKRVSKKRRGLRDQARQFAESVWSTLA